eukprot:g5304.t1
MVVPDTGTMDVYVDACEPRRGGGGGGGNSDDDDAAAELFAGEVERHDPEAVDVLLSTTFASCEVDHALDAQPSRGFMVLCLAHPEEEAETSVDGDQAGRGLEILALTHRDGHGATVALRPEAWPAAAGGMAGVGVGDAAAAAATAAAAAAAAAGGPLATDEGLATLRRAAGAAFRIRSRIPGVPWALFHPDGRPFEADGGAGAAGAATLLVFEGGSWIWPAVEVGHVHRLSGLPGLDGPVELKTLSVVPRVFEVQRFLLDAECDGIVGEAKPYMAQSTVIKMDGDQAKPTEEWRTSTTHFLHRGSSALVSALEERVAALTRVPVRHGEGVQVLRYEQSQKYNAHHDFFDPERYKSSAHAKSLVAGGKNRLATVFWYMSNVTAGGETNFPRAGGNPA